MFYRITPLSSGFMLTSMIGALISAMYIYDYSASFGFSLFLIFTLMFIASMVSMTLAPLEADFDLVDRKEKSKRKTKIKK
jgi:formate hydrogenlyase subunit 3/multisubunit Na+/H+ antiporter MnhD subunit